jgi:hypothetical protein
LAYANRPSTTIAIDTPGARVRANSSRRALHRNGVQRNGAFLSTHLSQMVAHRNGGHRQHGPTPSLTSVHPHLATFLLGGISENGSAARAVNGVSAVRFL